MKRNMMYFGFWMPSHAKLSTIWVLYLQFMSRVTLDKKYPKIFSMVMYS